MIICLAESNIDEYMCNVHTFQTAADVNRARNLSSKLYTVAAEKEANSNMMIHKHMIHIH